MPAPAKFDGIGRQALLEPKITSRKLVTVRTVDAIEPIPNADAIEVAVFGGWRPLVKRAEFAAGERAMCFEVDSALPLNDSRFAFLGPRGTKEIEGESFDVMRTAKLRGALSQGLVLAFARSPGGRCAQRTLLRRSGSSLYEPPCRWIWPVRCGVFSRPAPHLTAVQVAELDDRACFKVISDTWLLKG